MAQTRVRLPPDGAVIHGDHLAILGVTAPGNTVTVEGQKLKLEDGGHFVAVVPLKRGASVLHLKVTDPKGDEVDFERKVVSAPDGFVLLAAADTAAGATGAELPGVTPTTAWRWGRCTSTVARWCTGRAGGTATSACGRT